MRAGLFRCRFATPGHTVCLRGAEGVSGVVVSRAVRAEEECSALTGDGIVDRDAATVAALGVLNSVGCFLDGGSITSPPLPHCSGRGGGR